MAGATLSDAGRGLRYSNVAIALHWIIAALILYNMTSGLLRWALPPGFFTFHISSGVTILILSVARIAWRLTHPPPLFLEMSRWEQHIARGVHLLLYAAMLLLPLTGWAMVSAKPPPGSPGAAWSAAHPISSPEAGNAQHAGSGSHQRPRGPTMVWRMVKLPLITPIHQLGSTVDGIPQQREWRERFGTAHLIAAWAMLSLLLLHVSAALKHQFVDRQKAIARMTPAKAIRASP